MAKDKKWLWNLAVLFFVLLVNAVIVGVLLQSFMGAE
jgi:hypothetical protein